MTTLFAQPYDTSAQGFYFDSADAYDARTTLLRNASGQPVEEFEIQFIDGEGNLQAQYDLAVADKQTGEVIRHLPTKASLTSQSEQPL